MRSGSIARGIRKTLVSLLVLSLATGINPGSLNLYPWGAGPYPPDRGSLHSGSSLLSWKPRSALAAPPSSPSARFPDLERHWVRAYAEVLAGRGVFREIGPGQPFRPGEPVTRAEFVAWLVRTLLPHLPAGENPTGARPAAEPPSREGAALSRSREGPTLSQEREGPTLPLALEREGPTLSQEQGEFPLFRDQITFTPFRDIPPAHPFYEELSRARELGLVRGGVEGLFRPASPLTRQEAAALLVRAYDQVRSILASRSASPPVASRSTSPSEVTATSSSSPDSALSSFSDAPALAPWAREEVARAASLGLIQGEEKVEARRGGLARLKLLSPTKTLSRAEAATLVFRLENKIAMEKSTLLRSLPQIQTRTLVAMREVRSASPPPGAGGGKAAAGNPAPGAGNPGIGSGKSAAEALLPGSGKPAAGSGEGAADNSEPAAGNGGTGAGTNNSTGDGETSIGRNPPPGNGNPGTGDGKPAVDNGKSAPGSPGSGNTDSDNDPPAGSQHSADNRTSASDAAPPPAPPGNPEAGGVRWVEFLPPWDDAEPTATDMSFLLDPPAGKHGRVVVCGEHLCFEDGTRARFWGVNLTHDDCCPPKEQAAQIAAYLAKLGFNAVRLPHMSSDPYLGQLIDPSLPGHQKALEFLDRFDYFIAQLKARGIYVHLSTNHRPSFSRLPWIPDSLLLLEGDNKGWHSTRIATAIEELLQDAHKKFIQILLTHRNPYTGFTYAEEPAVAFLEIANENGLVDRWNPRTIENPIDQLPPYYQQKLDELWKLWSNNTQTQRPRGGDNISVEEKAQYFRFLADLDKQYYKNIITFIKNKIGFRGVIIGTQGFSWLEQWVQYQVADVLDSHAYWDSPQFTGKPKRENEWTTHGQSAIDNLEHSALAWLSFRRVAGKPFIVTEYNHSYPNPYGIEGIPLLAAIAARQDWDGAFVFHLSVSSQSANRNIFPFYDLTQHGGKLATLPLAAALSFGGEGEEINHSPPLLINPEYLPHLLASIPSTVRDTTQAVKQIGGKPSEFLSQWVGIAFEPRDITKSAPSFRKSPVIILEHGFLRISGKLVSLIVGNIGNQSLGENYFQISVIRDGVFGVVGVVTMLGINPHTEKHYLIVTAGGEPSSGPEAACLRERDIRVPCVPPRPLPLEINLLSGNRWVAPASSSPWLNLVYP